MTTSREWIDIALWMSSITWPTGLLLAGGLAGTAFFIGWCCGRK